MLHLILHVTLILYHNIRVFQAFFQALSQGLLFYYRGTKKCVLYKPENLLYTVLASRGTDPPRSKKSKIKQEIIS